ncbi:hypothetical protein IWW46_006063, partial [Coemansia sp. RSA 2440]
MEAAYNHSTGQVLDNLHVNVEDGLTDGQVVERQAKYGRNELPEEPPTPIWELILEQFQDQLVIILLMS